MSEWLRPTATSASRSFHLLTPEKPVTDCSETEGYSQPVEGSFY